MAIFEVRLFNEDAGMYRVLPLKAIAPGVSWRIDKKMGYADGAFSVCGDPLIDSQLVGLVPGRRIEFHGEGNRLYRGYVKLIDPAQSRENGVLVSKVTLAGRFELISTHRVQKRFALYGGTDAGNLIADLANRFVVPYEALPLTVASDITGVLFDSLDAWDITFGEAMGRILDGAGGGLVAGCDVAPDGTDRLFLRAVGATGGAGAARHVLTIPSRATGQVETEQNGDTVNTIYIQGGDARFVNYVAQAVKGNSDFEYPVLSQDTPGNLLTNPDFEEIDNFTRTPDDWTTSTDIIKAFGEGFGGAYSGRYFVRFNNSGEFIRQTSSNPDSNVVEGRDYSFTLWMKALTAINPQMSMSITWLDSGGSTLDTDEISIIPQSSAEYLQYTCPGRAPTGATAYRVRCEMITSSGEGVVLDSASFFATSGVSSLGWECVPLGTAAITNLDMAYSADAYHGAYCVYVEGTASDSGDNDIELRPAGQSKFALKEGSLFRFTVWVKKAPDAVGHPKVRLQLQCFGEDGEFNTTTDEDFPAGSDWDDWTPLPWEGVVPDNTAFCWPLVKIRGDCKLLIDAVMVTDQAAAEERFIENVQYLDTVDVRDVFESGDPEYNYHVDGNGAIRQKREEILEVSTVTTRDKALIYGRAYLAAHALPLTRKHIPVYRFKDFWPGDYARAVGSQRGKLPVPLPVAEVTGLWDGKIVLTAHLGEERLTEARLLRELTRKWIRQSKQGSATGNRPNRL